MVWNDTTPTNGSQGGSSHWLGYVMDPYDKPEKGAPSPCHIGRLRLKGH